MANPINDLFNLPQNIIKLVRLNRFMRDFESGAFEHVTSSLTDDYMERMKAESASGFKKFNEIKPFDVDEWKAKHYGNKQQNREVGIEFLKKMNQCGCKICKKHSKFVTATLAEEQS